VWFSLTLAGGGLLGFQVHKTPSLAIDTTEYGVLQTTAPPLPSTTHMSRSPSLLNGMKLSVQYW
jgi:hypothetical protein